MATKEITARFAGTCGSCGGGIRAGEQARAFVERYGDRVVGSDYYAWVLARHEAKAA